MQQLTATPAPLPPAEHGEGPRWDAARGELLWVDIAGGLLRRATVAADGVLTEGAAHRGGDTVGAVAPAADGWLLAAGGGFTHLTRSGTARVLLELAGEGGSEASGGTRMNDAACDPAGRFLAGTMAFDQRPGAGALYCLDLDGTVRTLLDGLTVSNGLGWSPDGGTFYLADSGPGLLWAFSYDVGAGALGPRRLLLEFSSGAVADGLTVDDSGCLWTALWGGGQVRRYSPDGELLAVVEVPVTQTSACCFAGPARDLLVTTTSTEGMSETDLVAQPDAGRLFTARPGATAPAATPYRGPLTALSQLP